MLRLISIVALIALLIALQTPSGRAEEPTPQPVPNARMAGGPQSRGERLDPRWSRVRATRGEGRRPVSRPNPARIGGEAVATGPGDDRWDARFSTHGINGLVFAVAVSGPYIYVGGEFTMAGSVNARNIARWDGQQWSALGGGVNDTVSTVAVAGSRIYVGGAFGEAYEANGDTERVNGIAMWDGQQWSPLGDGVNDWVFAIVARADEVYAGGWFTTASDGLGHMVTVNHVARWSNGRWTALGGGVNDYVHALAWGGDRLYVGGWLTSVEQADHSRLEAHHVVSWDGQAWRALGGGVNNYVYALGVAGTDVYAGGWFTSASNGGEAVVDANYVARWDGRQWSALAGSVNDWVLTIRPSGSDVYIGGTFSGARNAGNAAVDSAGIVKWDGSSWSGLGRGLDGPANAIATQGSDVYVGGQFSTAGGKPSARFGLWHGGLVRHALFLPLLISGE